MKTFLALIVLLAVAGCATQKELQADIVRAELIKIDTIHRYSAQVEHLQQLLTWRDPDNIEYVTIVPMYVNYSLGTRIQMLKPK